MKWIKLLKSAQIVVQYAQQPCLDPVGLFQAFVHAVEFLLTLRFGLDEGREFGEYFIETDSGFGDV
jgi:hypothetical protein